jgi:hypothetical protein
VQFLKYAKLAVPSRLEPSLAKVRAAIERDDFYSADVKKLTSSKYFRAGLDYDSRLLLEFVEYAGARACLALEIIEKHAYDRSRFLRGTRVDDANLPGPVGAGDVEVNEATARVRYLHPSRTEFHLLDKPISFDDRQEELHRLPLPMVLVGCAGSGKTALTLTKLRELSGDVLYVTASPYLAECAAALYFAHGYESSHQSVDFLSYRALLESIEVPLGRPVNSSDFRAFFRRHEQAFRFTSAHQLFEEMRGVIGADQGGPLSLEDYLGRGVRQSIYRPEERALVHGMFAKYRAWLEDAKLLDTNLVAHAYRPRAEPQYDAVVVDEVQDLTNAELALVLAMLRQADQFLLCGDANQIVHPNFFSWSSVKSLFYSEEAAAVAAPIHVLSVNYRSSRAVCRIANDLLKIKNARFGSVDRESTALVAPAADIAGRVVGLLDKENVVRQLNERIRKSARVAVIVLNEEQKAEARRRFTTPLVFTIHEAKGLEYDTVVLYGLISTERARFREVSEGISKEELERDSLSYARARDKSDKSLEVYKFFVNALYVALTRAVDSIYIVESDSAHPLLGLLRVVCGEDLSNLAANESTIEDWQREARRLELQGKDEQAEAIRRSILRLAPVPWPVLDANEVRQTHGRALAPRSVYAKAKQRLFEFAAFHELGTLAYSLKYAAGYMPPKPAEVLARSLRERAMGHYLSGDEAKVLSEVERYGVEHRNVFGMTPLMMAADAGAVRLTETLVNRGARLDAVDPLGRMAVHFALRRAFADAAFAVERLGALFSVVCPLAIEIEVDNRRLRLARGQGEFLLLLFFVSRLHELYRMSGRSGAFTAKLVDEKALAAFPRSIVPDERRRRTYWNGVLARAEVSSSYKPARRLWRRERVGHYMPSSVGIRVAADGGSGESFVPLHRLLGLDFLDPVLAAEAEKTPSPPSVEVLDAASGDGAG